MTGFYSALTSYRLQGIPKIKSSGNKKAPKIKGSLWDGWKLIGITPIIRGLVVGMVGAYVAGGTVIGLVRICLGDLGRGQAANGVRFGAVFFGMALGMWLGPSVVAGFSRRRLFGLALIFAGASLALLALIPNLVLALTMSVILGSCAGLARVMGLRANLRVRFEFGQRSLTNLDSNATPLKMLPMPGR